MRLDGMYGFVLVLVARSERTDRRVFRDGEFSGPSIARQVQLLPPGAAQKPPHGPAPEKMPVGPRHAWPLFDGRICTPRARRSHDHSRPGHSRFTIAAFMTKSPYTTRNRMLVSAAPLKSTVAVLFSGGLDSAILLAHLLAQEHHVVPLYVHSELHWQHEELRRAREFLRAVDARTLANLVVLRLPLSDLYDGHWSTTGREVPRASEPDDHVYLPGRNPLLLIKAHVWCHLHGITQLALGSLKSNPFADATDGFFAQFEAAMNVAVSGQVKFVRPLAALDKRQVMALGRQMPLELTFSCLAPAGGRHCGKCNKCAERQAAFRIGGVPDPTHYAVTARAVAILRRIGS